jgi:tocopherol O-methyltransferase
MDNNTMPNLELDPLHRGIAEYYDQTELDYRLTGFLRQDALHYGWWDGTTASLADALNRENEVLAEVANIQPGESVLDAGCGVGGSSLYLAGMGAKVTGITVSSRQVNTAREKAFRAGLSEGIRFEQRSYTDTGYPPESFDVVWALESVGHTPKKDEFIDEAYRILKPGGRLIMADGWATHPRANQHRAMQRLMAAWASPGVQLDTLDRFAASLGKHGFNVERASEETEHIIPTVQHLYRWYVRTRAIHQAMRVVKLRSDVQTRNHGSARDQYQAWRDGALQYGVVLARKDLAEAA